MSVKLFPCDSISPVTILIFEAVPLNASRCPDEFGAEPNDQGESWIFVNWARFPFAKYSLPMKFAETLTKNASFTTFNATQGCHLNTRLDGFVTEVDRREYRAHPFHRAGQVHLLVVTVLHILFQQR